MTLSYWLDEPTYKHLCIVTKCCYDQSYTEKREHAVRGGETEILAKQETHNNTGRVSSLRPF